MQAATGGIDRVRVNANNVRQMYSLLRELFPDLTDTLDSGLALSVDGEIISDPLLEELSPDSEVHFLPQIGGG